MCLFFFQISENDGLPQKLCKTCFNQMNNAYHFRTQCIKMDNELKVQIETLKQASKQTITVEPEKSVENDVSENFNDPLKQLESVIKNEPLDSDDDYYFVVVIDDQKENQNDVSVDFVKKEEEVVQERFEDSIDSFLVTGDKVPDSVPATILQNEEDDSNFDDMNIVEQTDDLETQPQIEDEIVEDIGNIPESDDDNVETITADLQDLPNKNFIKLLTSAGPDGNIIFKTADNVTYLADTQLGESMDEDGLPQEEVIVYEEGDNSQYQILTCNNGNLIIQYADDNQMILKDESELFCGCGVQCEDLDAYEKHQATHLDSHLCNLCGKGFESAEILTGHMMLHKVRGPNILCPFCNQLIKRNALTQHIKYGHNNIKTRCKICAKTFANPNNLKRHMMIHNGIKQFECDICLKRFHQKITMQTHRLTHIDPFSCNLCEMSFQNKIELSNHKDSGECSKSKLHRIRDELVKTLKRDIKNKEGNVLGFACTMCKKMFSLESAFDIHVDSIHLTNSTQLVCTECLEVKATEKELVSHMATHKNARNKNMKRFECGVCGKGCPSRAMLLMHERVHTDERPYPCQLCTSKFKTKTHLRTHQLTHTREKKFGCSICMKFFALKGNLVVHLRTHTGERPYVCNLCGEGFIDSKYLKKHKKKKHAIVNVPWNQY